jgi:hypothetical protein
VGELKIAPDFANSRHAEDPDVPDRYGIVPYRQAAMRRFQGLLVCFAALAMMALVAFAPPRAAAATADHAVVVGTRACKHRHVGRGPKETVARRRCMRKVRES